LPLQEREAVATEMVVKDDQQRDVSSSLVCIAWGLLNIIQTVNIHLSRMNICHTLLAIAFAANTCGCYVKSSGGCSSFQGGERGSET